MKDKTFKQLKEVVYDLMVEQMEGYEEVFNLDYVATSHLDEILDDVLTVFESDMSDVITKLNEIEKNKTNILGEE